MEILTLFIPLLIIYFLYSYLKTKVNPTGQVILTIIFSIFFVGGIIIGLLIGMDLGGNYYGDFVFSGLRGYEAVGQIGATIGGLLGAVCGFLLIVGLKGNRKFK